MYRNIYGSISIDIACKRLVTACIACFIMLFPGASGLQAQPPGAFITTWSGSSITIPTYSGETYDYNIYWEEENNSGNNGSSSGHTGDATIKFGADGTYLVHITGTFPHFYLQGSTEGYKLKTVEQWGNISWTSMQEAFAYSRNLVINATDAPDLSKVESLDRMFHHAEGFNADLSGWDVSNVKDMSKMFQMTDAFNGNISGWNVSEVTLMARMFNNATAFNRDIGSWNVSKVTSMVGMFDKASEFNQDIGSWDVSNVEMMNFMFMDAGSFNQDLSGWDIGNANSMHSFFTGSGLDAANYSAILDGWAALSSLPRGMHIYNVGSIDNPTP